MVLNGVKPFKKIERELVFSFRSRLFNSENTITTVLIDSLVYNASSLTRAAGAGGISQGFLRPAGSNAAVCAIICGLWLSQTGMWAVQAGLPAVKSGYNRGVEQQA